MKTKFSLSLPCNSNDSHLFGNRKEICKFKATDKNAIFPNQFCLGSITKKIDYDDSEEVSFKENVYDFSVD